MVKQLNYVYGVIISNNQMGSGISESNYQVPKFIWFGHSVLFTPSSKHLNMVLNISSYVEQKLVIDFIWNVLIFVIFYIAYAVDVDFKISFITVLCVIGVMVLFQHSLYTNIDKSYLRNWNISINRNNIYFKELFICFGCSWHHFLFF